MKDRTFIERSHKKKNMDLKLENLYTNESKRQNWM